MISIHLQDKTGEPSICDALAALASLATVQAAGEFRRAWLTDDVCVSSTAGTWPAFIVRTLDDPAALAYHNDATEPAIYVGADVILGSDGGSIFHGSNSLLAALSHEVLEVLEDAYCQFYSPWTDARMVALEVCDPVQADSYEVTDGTNRGSVSNFVLPPWFGSPGTKYDYLGTLSAPRTLAPGGYVVFSDGSQLFGDDVSHAARARKKKTSRRLRSMGHMMTLADSVRGNDVVNGLLQARAEERAAIVAWLRCGDADDEMTADAIEAGDHWNHRRDP